VRTRSGPAAVIGYKGLDNHWFVKESGRWGTKE